MNDYPFLNDIGKATKDIQNIVKRGSTGGNNRRKHKSTEKHCIKQRESKEKQI